MGRKSNKELLKQQLDESLTVQRLIDHLKTLPADIHIGVVGHFGEAYLLNKHAFSHISESYITSNGSWRENLKHNIQILSLEIPDIGPIPD
jgi:hypothetical protein